MLAHYYDALVKDDVATNMWVAFVERFVKPGKIMEVACGSGEITIALAEKGYTMHASDYSIEMIEEAQKKPGSSSVKWKQMDMCVFDDAQQYAGILCFCDSFNYVLEKQQVCDFFQHVYDHLNDDGIFLMDMHSMDRLDEFQEEYNEAGVVMGCEYQWTIVSRDDRILQTFAFYDETGNAILERHEQRVYDPIWIKQVLENIGFHVKIMTDFHHVGICEGEKQFFICRKERI